jgi:hypothetical protein
MFSKAKVVKAARKAVESLYEGTCTITENQKVQKANKSIGFEEVVVLADQPCRVSYKTTNTITPDGNGASAVIQGIKLFIAPEIDIKPGSKLTITQNGATSYFKRSGKPARYITHQEVELDLFKGWS